MTQTHENTHTKAHTANIPQYSVKNWN